MNIRNRIILPGALSAPQCESSPFYFTCFLRQEHFSWSIWILKKLKFSELRHPVCYLELLEHSLVVMHCALTLFISQKALFPFHNAAWKEEHSVCHPSVLSLLFSSFLMGFLVEFRTVIPCSTALRTQDDVNGTKRGFYAGLYKRHQNSKPNLGTINAWASLGMLRGHCLAGVSVLCQISFPPWRMDALGALIPCCLPPPYWNLNIRMFCDS